MVIATDPSVQRPSPQLTNRVPVLRRVTRSPVGRMLMLVARAALTSLGVVVITFVLVRLIPGDPVEILLFDLNVPNPEEVADRYRTMLGLDGSIFEQLARYLGNVFTGDLGTSLTTRQPVSTTIKNALPVTAWLIVVTVTMALVISVPLAVLVAMHRGSWLDRLFRVLSSISLATPGFYLGLLLILLVSLRWGIAPVGGYRPGFPGNLYYLWLPALTMCGVLVPVLTRVLASSVTDTLEEEYVEGAISRGLPTRVLIWRYLVRPSIAPTLGLLSYMVGQMLGAAVVVEMVFNLPGIGTALILEGVLPRDYTIVQGIVLVFGVAVVLVSFGAEVLSGVLDPRVRRW
jgi:peptide/nickel transport system permease protein